MRPLPSPTSRRRLAVQGPAAPHRSVLARLPQGLLRLRFVPTNKPLDTRAIVTPLEPSLHRTLPPTPEKHTHPGLLMRGHPLGMKIYSAARLGLQSHSRSARTHAGRARSGGRWGVGSVGCGEGEHARREGGGGAKLPSISSCTARVRSSGAAVSQLTRGGWRGRERGLCRSTVGAGPARARRVLRPAEPPLPRSPSPQAVERAGLGRGGSGKWEPPGSPAHAPSRTRRV